MLSQESPTYMTWEKGGFILRKFTLPFTVGDFYEPLFAVG